MEFTDINQQIPVAIIGGGPTGLALALGLARNNVRSVLIEKNEGISEYSKAPALHVRSLEILSQWGIGEKLLEKGELLEHLQVQDANKDEVLFSLDFTLLEKEADKPGILILEQAETEEILLEAVRETGMCDLRFSSEAVAIQEINGGVRLTVEARNGRQELQADYLVGCDGANSFTRDSLKLPFSGITYAVNTTLADIKINDERDKLPWPRLYNDKYGITVGLRLSPGIWRIIRLESNHTEIGEEISEQELALKIRQTMGSGPFEVVWSSPFKIHRRSSPFFRKGRTLLAGDAAHIHSPVGAQGMNAGIQDAHNLAWKLALALSSGNAERLLKSFDTERQEVVVKKVSGYTDFMTRLFLQAPLPIRKSSFFMLQMSSAIKSLHLKFLRRAAMINLDYSPSEIASLHTELSGKKLPNLELHVPGKKPTRLYNLLPYKPVILAIGNIGDFTEEAALDVIKIAPEHYNDRKATLQVMMGKQRGWYLVRPDMHIAWAGDDLEELEKAALQYFGINLWTNPFFAQ